MSVDEAKVNVLEKIVLEYRSHGGPRTHTACPYACQLSDLIAYAENLFGGPEWTARMLFPKADR